MRSNSLLLGTKMPVTKLYGVGENVPNRLRVREFTPRLTLRIIFRADTSFAET